MRFSDKAIPSVYSALFVLAANGIQLMFFLGNEL